MVRVFCASLATETNTFSPMPTGMDDYDIIRAHERMDEDDESILNRETVFRRLSEERGWEFVMSLSAFAQPAGKTVRSVYESLRDEILADLRAALPVDIVFLPLHGSMIADGYDDCETDMIHRVREIVGPNAKIGVHLDPHCDVTEQMCEEADAIILMKEYPHSDGVPRAEELFAIIADAHQGKVQPVMRMHDCRMIGLFMTPVQPMRGFVDRMHEREGESGVLSCSLVHCFPWADVATTGTRTLVIADRDAALAERVAEELAAELFQIRHHVAATSRPMAETFRRALAIDRGGKPVVIADQADNPGGGAPSDSTFVTRYLIEQGIGDACIGLFWDPIAVRIAFAAGEGAELEMRIGGKMGPSSGDPLDLRVKVMGLQRDMEQIIDWGENEHRIPLGDACALRTAQEIDLVLISKRTQLLTPQVFRHFGLEPEKRSLLIVKSTQHFYGSFAPIAAEVLYMSAPGAIPPQFTEIPYQNVDLHKFPWLDDPFAAG